MSDLITVAKSVGTAAVLSHNRVRLGVGVGWCEEEYIQTGQDFHTRGKRLDDMIPALRALWQGGWVEYHGTYYDVPLCQMNPSPALPVPIIGGGTRIPPCGGPPRSVTDGSTPGPPSPTRPWRGRRSITTPSSGRVARTSPSPSTWPCGPFPTSTSTGSFEDAGVTDILCAPWMAVTR